MRPNTVDAIRSAAAVGTDYALAEHPEWRPGFVEATKDLLIVEESELVSFNTILRIVQRLPVKELKSRDARLAIAGGTILLTAYGGQLETDLQTSQNLRAVARALRVGIEEGL